MSTELAIWLISSVAGFLTAFLSLQTANLVLRSVRMKNESEVVISGSVHIRTTQLLLMLGWLLFLFVGVVSVFLPRPDPPPQPTLAGMILGWSLIGAEVIWAITTVNDYIYTRKMWQRVLASRFTKE